MQRRIRRLVLATSSVIVLFAIVAAPALAATMTTQEASQLTTTTAVLNGVVGTGGVATAWQFQYGTTTAYGSNTPLQQIPAGKGDVSVSSMVQGLSPNTTYHFRLIGITAVGTYLSPPTVTFGRDLTFTTTATGKTELFRRRLIVSNGFVTVPLRCMSGLTCHGRFTIGTSARVAGTNTFARVLCATTFYTVDPNTTGNIRTRVHNGCLSLLGTSPRHTRLALLTSNPRTGQQALITNVILVLR
jgi:hypothetical protein